MKNFLATLCLLALVLASAGPARGYITTSPGGGSGSGLGTNVVTNPTFLTSSNNNGGITYSNVPGDRPYFDFWGLSESNNVILSFSKLPHDSAYGYIKPNTTHGGGTANPATGELEIYAPNYLALTIAGDGSPGHMQIGGTGLGQHWTYFTTYGGAGTVSNTVSPSGATTWRSMWKSNNILFDVYPGMFAAWQKTNDATTGYEYRLSFVNDLGAAQNGDVWNATNRMHSLDLFYGMAPNGSNYNRVVLTASLDSGTTNSITVDTNNITLNAVKGGQIIVGPSANTAIGTNGALTTIGNTVEVSLNASGSLRVINGGGAATLANSYFACGPAEGGTMFPLSNVSINTNAVASHGNLDVAGIIWALTGEEGPTNYLAANFAPPAVAGDVKIVKSNNWFWAVSQAYTNRFLQFGP